MQMSTLSIFCGIGLLFYCAAAGESNDEIDEEHFEGLDDEIHEEHFEGLVPRIVNGSQAHLGQFPQQVSLRRRYSHNHFCGGSILATYWVLTAAHCMLADNHGKYVPADSIIVMGGTIYLEKPNKKNLQWSIVSDCIVHPRFNMRNLHNDVSLLKMQRPFVFDQFVHSAPVKRDKIAPHTVCLVSGWGHIAYRGEISHHLLFVDMPLLPRKLCRRLLRNISSIPPGMFCSGHIEGGKDACQGDSGGGLLCEGYIAGVVSGGKGCALPNLPGLYADVKYYIPWIEKYVDLENEFDANTESSHSHSLTSRNIGEPSTATHKNESSSNSSPDTSCTLQIICTFTIPISVFGLMFNL